jgi:hypothetical protein
MSGPVELVVIDGEEPHNAFRVGGKPFTIGRGPDNNLVIADSRVSWNHAQIWVEGGRIWVKDLASRNGTFVNEERLRDPAEVTDGDRVKLGPALELLIRGEPVTSSAPRALALEDIDAELRVPLRTDRFHIGRTGEVDLRLDTLVEGAVLIIHPDGEVWLGGEDHSEMPLGLGEIFELGGRRFRVVEVDATRQPTVEQEPDRYPYRLVATLDGATGPEARLEDPSAANKIHRVEADNRAVLLYLLGRQRQQDREAGLPRTERGWCADAEIVTGIWGKAGRNEDPNRLHVLVHRLRKEIKAAGFDPWCIEKRHRYIRIRVADVDLS